MDAEVNVQEERSLDYEGTSTAEGVLSAKLMKDVKGKGKAIDRVATPNPESDEGIPGVPGTTVESGSYGAFLVDVWGEQPGLLVKSEWCNFRHLLRKDRAPAYLKEAVGVASQTEITDIAISHYTRGNRGGQGSRGSQGGRGGRSSRRGRGGRGGQGSRGSRGSRGGGGGAGSQGGGGGAGNRVLGGGGDRRTKAFQFHT